MSSLFIAFTPYQCINATTLALSNTDNECDIVLIEWGNDGNQMLIDNLYKVFKKVYIIPNINCLRKNKKWTIRDYYIYTKKIRTLVKKIKKNHYSKIYASSENHLYVQFILRKLLDDAVKYYHFEDGSFEYSSYFEKSKGIRDDIGRICQGLSLGYYKKLYTFPGQAKEIKKLYLLYPELRRIQLINKNVAKIDQNLFCKSLNILYPGVESISCGVVMCLDLSDRGENIKNLNQEVYNITKTYNAFNNIYLKYHPREFSANYYIQTDEKCKFIDSHLPIECVLKDFRGVMISNLSSSLHVLKFMNPDMHIVCTAYLDSEIKDRAYVDMLAKINVKMPKTTDELVFLLKNFY